MPIVIWSALDVQQTGTGPKPNVPQSVASNGCSALFVTVGDDLIFFIKIGDIEYLWVRQTAHMRITPFALFNLSKACGKVHVRFVVGKIRVSDYHNTILVESVSHFLKDVI